MISEKSELENMVKDALMAIRRKYRIKEYEPIFLKDGTIHSTLRSPHDFDLFNKELNSEENIHIFTGNKKIEKDFLEFLPNKFRDRVKISARWEREWWFTISIKLASSKN